MSRAGKVMKEGFLIKSPPQERLMAQWQRRYFVLWSSRLMEYYSSKEKRPQDYRKTIDLNNCEDMVAPLPVHNRQFVIKLSVNLDNKKSRDYYFECGSECEMESWVKCLASVCGFSAVEEAEVSPLCPEFDTSITSSMNINKPKLRPPLPPPKKPLSSSPPPVIEEVFYEDPQLLMTKPPSKLEDSIEEVYDNIDDENIIRQMNMFPPPVWKQDDGLQPPPLPPCHPTRRYTRSFDQSTEFVKVDEWKAPKLPEARSKKPKETPKLRNHFGSLKDSPRMSKNKVKTKPPTPPAKPWKSGSSDDLLSTSSSELLGGGRRGERGGGGHGATSRKGMGFNLKNDPKFGEKLQERRQELYGGTVDRSRPRSWGHDQEAYEEVPFTASDDDLLDGECAAGGRKSGDPSDNDEYVDCQPHEDDDDTPAMYLEHCTRLDGRSVNLPVAGEKGPNTLKREEFLKRPPLPLPPHSSAGNPIHKSPPKVPAGGRPTAGGGGGAAAAFVRPPMATTAGSDLPPPVPKRGNERPPMPLPGAVGDGFGDDDDEAPPVPRRHPHASDKHRALTVDDSSSSSRRFSPTENSIPLPPRSVSPSTPPYPSPTSNDNAPRLHQRGPRQFDSPSPTPTNQPKNKKAKPPPPLIRKQRSLSPEDLSSPASAHSDQVFEPFTFGQGPPSIPHTLPQTNKSSKVKPYPSVPVKNPASTINRANYETELPADIGMRPKKKILSYEVNLPPSIGNRPPVQTTRPETAPSSDTAKPRPPMKPPVAVKPTQPKSPPHAPVKPQVSKKPVGTIGTSGRPAIQPKPLTVTPKPAVGHGTTNPAAFRGVKVINKGGVTNSTTSGRNFHSSDASYNSQPATASKAARTRNGATKPPAPPGKPKPLLPPTVDRRKQLPTPSY